MNICACMGITLQKIQFVSSLTCRGYSYKRNSSTSFIEIYKGMVEIRIRETNIMNNLIAKHKPMQR